MSDAFPTIHESVNPELIQVKLEKIRALEKKNELREGLPFLHGWKWYPWARSFYESTAKQNFLCAANQISKSSTQIRKCINWATDQSLWPILWRTVPRVFWYLYPAKDVATIEFKKKWVTEFLPAGKYKDDPVYGWKEEYKKSEIHAIHFHSGVSVYFKSYTQETTNLQTGTVHAIFCDEELPVEHYDELMLRLEATDGYFHMVFTATLGQEFWYKVIERRGEKDELLADAFKLQISMYDCLHYDDGSPSFWTEEKIQRAKNRCRSQNEILKRIYGRFVKDTGLVYPGYDRDRNRHGKGPIPEGWSIFAAVDIGSGGATGHPAAIVFVAVDPFFRKGRVFKAWRGDGITTTASDILMKFLELRGKMKLSRQFYDYGSADFYNIASGLNEPFEKADKNHEHGESVLNVLFKNGMLTLDEDDGEIDKLEIEMSMYTKDQDPKKAKNDLCDALRYACAKIPWDWKAIGTEDPEAGKKTKGWIDPAHIGKGIDELARAGLLPKEAYPMDNALAQEFAEANDAYGA